MLRILICMVFGAVLLLMPPNGFATILGDVAYTAVLLVQSIVVFALAVITKHGIKLFVKGLVRFVLRLTVVHLVRLYIMMHPDISNARVEQYRDRLVVRVRERLMRVHGMHRVMATFGIISAAVTVFAVLIVVGALRFMYEFLIGPLTSVVTRTVVGKVVLAWSRLMATLLRTYVRDQYHRVCVWYIRVNMRMLRASARRYRRLHRRKDNEAE